jgi:hypothetical protein
MFRARHQWESRSAKVPREAKGMLVPQCHNATVPQGSQGNTSAAVSQCHSSTVPQCHSAPVPQFRSRRARTPRSVGGETRSPRPASERSPSRDRASNELDYGVQDDGVLPKGGREGRVDIHGGRDDIIALQEHFQVEAGGYDGHVGRILTRRGKSGGGDRCGEATPCAGRPCPAQASAKASRGGVQQRGVSANHNAIIIQS